MARRGTALVPTRVQIDNFPTYAEQGGAKFPAYAAHMRDLHARCDATLRSAHEAGVPIYAGTDAGGVLPHGLVGREVLALHEQVGPGHGRRAGRRRPGRPATGWAGRGSAPATRPTWWSTTPTRGPTCAPWPTPAPSSCAAASSPDLPP